MVLRPEDLIRYRRNIVIPAIGNSGQEKLLNSKVLVVGAGGLGSSALYYLTAAGIGEIGIVDFDIVELENLQRQILHTTDDIGRLKVESAKEKLQKINPNLEVISYDKMLTSDNVPGIIKNYDLVVECSDNFSTKYLLNDACVVNKMPLMYAAVMRFEGQAMTILPGKSACYRCVFSDTPPKNMFISPKEAGILGAVAGILGLIQANEVIKYILNIGDLLVNKLLIFDSLSLDFKKVNTQVDVSCLACGQD